jgi:hypothetical protein
MFIALLDKDFQALGKRTTYPTSQWSLTRRAYEMDSFTATCEEISKSAKAVYVALFSDNGRKLKYIALSGIPKNQDSLTKVTAMDFRRVFLQKCWIDYASYQSAPTVKKWVNYLLGLPKALAGSYLGVDYTVDLSDFDVSTPAWVSGSIPSVSAEGDVWEELQAAMMRYGFTVVVEGNITTDSATGKTTGSITVKAKVLSGTHTVKLKDFNHARVIDDSTNVNRAIARNTAGSTVVEYWILYGADGTETVTTKENAVSLMTASPASYYLKYPPRYEVYVDDEDIQKAKAKAMDALEKNRYRGSVELDLNTAIGKDLREANVWSMGKIYGYNSADDSTAKVLPIMWIKEGSDGSMSCCFGRLDDYYYI